MAAAKKKDYLIILKAVEELPFNVGRNLLIDFLRGEEGNESVRKHKLEKLSCFGSMAYSKGELNSEIGNLLMNKILELASFEGSKFGKVIKLTEKGRAELKTPGCNGFGERASVSHKDMCDIHQKTILTDEDKQLFEAFSFFLDDYNDEQKKAIVSPKKNILCIAGAGSGKTTVLTKRIEFLIKFRSVPSDKILAITFTRKARQEMMRRLLKAGIAQEVKVETFNSFCEKLLKKHETMVYGRQVRVVGYADKIRIMKSAIAKMNIGPEYAINKYFNPGQRRGKSDEQLMSIFMNDCFFVRDYFKFKNKDLSEFSFDLGSRNSENARMVQGICQHIGETFEKHGLRDYADQLLDVIKLFREHPELIPKFDHILIDEYQDVNSTQIELVNILNPPNLFCVGDPRQAIYGWRGSDIKYILDFEEEHDGKGNRNKSQSKGAGQSKGTAGGDAAAAACGSCEIINLTKNYRSTKHIVELINACIRNMKLPNLESGAAAGEDGVKLLNFNSEEAEYEFVIQRILAADVPRNEIFVLARTNKQLNEFADLFKQRGIKCVVKSEDIHTEIVLIEGEVILATVHAIKGLEAEMVFVVGCTSNNFPCKGSEHPVIEMVKVEEYDKEEEERRLLYVAMSRAKSSLYLSYTGKGLSSFITREMIELIEPSHDALKQRQLDDYDFEHRNDYKIKQGSKDIVMRLQEWRKRTSEALGVPPFMIMHDRTMYDIAVKMPLEHDDLHQIHGLGPTKIRKYGEEILDIVAK